MGAKGIDLTGALSLVLLRLSSCFHLYFDRVQPMGVVELMTIPDEWQRRWH